MDHEREHRKPAFLKPSALRLQRVTLPRGTDAAHSTEPPSRPKSKRSSASASAGTTTSANASANASASANPHEQPTLIIDRAARTAAWARARRAAELGNGAGGTGSRVRTVALIAFVALAALVGAAAAFVPERFIPMSRHDAADSPTGADGSEHAVTAAPAGTGSGVGSRVSVDVDVDLDAPAIAPIGAAPGSTETTGTVAPGRAIPPSSAPRKPSRNAVDMETLVF
jgi:hypothetical protein